MLGQKSSVTDLLTVICKYAAATQHSKNQQNRITVSADKSIHTFVSQVIYKKLFLWLLSWFCIELRNISEINYKCNDMSFYLTATGKYNDQLPRPVTDIF